MDKRAGDSPYPFSTSNPYRISGLQEWRTVSAYLSLIQHIKNCPAYLMRKRLRRVWVVSGRTFYTLGRVSQSSPGATTPAMDAKNLILSVGAIPLPIPGTT